MKTANSHTDFFPVLNSMFLDVDIACIAIPMCGCIDSFQIINVVTSQLPMKAENPRYVCIQLCKHALLLIDPVALGFSREICENGA